MSECPIPGANKPCQRLTYRLHRPPACQAAILFDGTPRGGAWGTTPCAAAPPHVVWGNLVVKSSAALGGPLVQVGAACGGWGREDGCG